MIRDIFVCFPKKQYNYFNMKKTLVLLLFVLSFLTSHAQNYKLHSLFIFSFTRYVQWPESHNQGDFEIVVLGDTPLTDELKTMAQAKKVGDRPIKISKINSIGELKKCNILFIPASKSAMIAEVLGKVSAQPVLIVTEETGMGAKGSNINFITKDGKLAFELNQNTLTKQNLKVSNELSRLAILI
jgi:hypothetical protein